MTDKCRRMMNGREEYITTEITQSRGGTTKKKREARARKGAPGVREELWIPVLERGVPSPWDVGPPDSVCFSPPNKPSPHQSPTFGPTLYKFIVIGLVRKPRPYNWHRLWESCSCDDECNNLLRWGQIP